MRKLIMACTLSLAWRKIFDEGGGGGGGERLHNPSIKGIFRIRSLIYLRCIRNIPNMFYQV